MTQDLDGIRRRYRRFGEVEAGSYSPLYRELSHAVANDDDLVGFIDSMPDGQPNLLLASIQYLTGAKAMPRTARELGDFVAARRHEVAALMRTRRTQTNEIGRCTAILPALPPGPLALLEVGASGGLCLLLDRFQYDYGTTCVGAPDSSVTLRCAGLGSIPVPVPASVPNVVWRRGLDLSPLDLARSEEADWLVACVWADHDERRERLRAAIAMARSHPVRVDRGDLATDLEGVLDEAPPSATLVVFHSAVLNYLSPDRRAAFSVSLADYSRRRDIVWISNEGPGVIPKLDRMAPDRPDLKFRLGRTVFSQGRGEAQLLALAHYHGWDLEWLAANNKAS
jgi:hypothetical protein